MPDVAQGELVAALAVTALADSAADRPAAEVGILVEPALPELPAALPEPRKVILGTGLLFAESLDRAVEPLRQIAGLDIEVRAVENKTFGRITTVAGLLTGRCFRHAVQPGEADLLIVPPTTLRYGTELMLDDVSLSELRNEFRMDVRAGGSTLGELARVILDGAQSSGHQWGMSAHAVKDSGRGGAAPGEALETDVAESGMHGEGVKGRGQA